MGRMSFREYQFRPSCILKGRAVLSLGLTGYGEALIHYSWRIKKVTMYCQMSAVAKWLINILQNESISLCLFTSLWMFGPFF